MKFFPCIFILFTVVFPVFGNDYRLTQKDAEASKRCNLLADEVSYDFAKKMKEEKKLYAIGVGGGGTGKPGILRVLSMSFETDKKVDISQARLLLFECVETFLKEIKAKEELKPYLSTVPFTPSNIDITIYFYKKTRSLMNPPYLAVARAKEGKFDYTVDSDEQLEFVKEETYEEALEILQQEKLSKRH